MNRFINRVDDLDFLQSQYDNSKASLVILYGRRRVGKTSLIHEFGKNKNMLFFLATEESELINREKFKALVADYTENEILKNAFVDNWEVIFNVLSQHKPEEKMLVVFDEFQYIGKSNTSFPSIFQKIWESLRNLNIMVILCGSLISLMESQTLSYDSPLYGRRTGQIKLKPIAFQYYNEFYARKSKKELIEYYSVTGGVPKYIELFNEESDIFSAIEKHVLSPRSFLYEEPVFLLQREVFEIGNYFSLIRAIAAGNRKLSSIASVLGVKQTNLTKYLKTLIDLDIIERQVPVTENNPGKSKRGQYRIKDNFIEFWFKFIYPQQSNIETGRSNYVMSKIREDFINRHVSYVYEDICRQSLWIIAEENKLPFRFDKIGSWWEGNREIDIVALDSTGEDIIFGECKYTTNPMGPEVFYKLIEAKDYVRWKNEIRSEYYVFFSINGYKKQLKELADSRSDIFLL